MLVTRIAPTPSGPSHTGNAYHYIFTWLLARLNGGKLLLRIDDLDADRKRTAYVENIIRTLEWIGIDWDLGPDSVGGFERDYSQQLRMENYRQALKQLEDAGRLYACACSRKQIRAKTGSSRYPGTCRSRNLHYDPATCVKRFRLPGNARVALSDKWRGPQSVDLQRAMGDFVVCRKRGIPAYQLASIADDCYFGVNTIVRGSDLLESTCAQLMLAPHLDAPEFTFYHHPLVRDQAGGKLSKSTIQDTHLTARIGEFSREELFTGFIRWMNWKQKPLKNLGELLDYAGTVKPNPLLVAGSK